MIMRGDNSFFSLLLAGVVILTILTVPVSAAKLVTPILVSPQANQIFYDSQGWVSCAWKPVPGVTSYYFEIQAKDGLAWKPYNQYYLSDTETHFQIPWAVPYRWRVVATNGNPADASNPSAWRTFSFNWEKNKLATPVPITPKGGIMFFNTPRTIFLGWKPVLGANSYNVYLQFYIPSLKRWVDFGSVPIIISGAHRTSYITTVYEPGQVRWCVQAQDSTGAWISSNPTPWQTFTFKN